MEALFLAMMTMVMTPVAVLVLLTKHANARREARQAELHKLQQEAVAKGLPLVSAPPAPTGGTVALGIAAKVAGAALGAVLKDQLGHRHHGHHKHH